MDIIAASLSINDSAAAISNIPNVDLASTSGGATELAQPLQ